VKEMVKLMTLKEALLRRQPKYLYLHILVKKGKKRASTAIGAAGTTARSCLPARAMVKFC